MTGWSSRRPRRASAEGGTELTHYAGIDVSLETSSICIVDSSGAVLRELKAESEPEALAAALTGTGLEFTRVGLEAGPMSQWLHAWLKAAGLPAVLLETRQLRAATKAVLLRSLGLVAALLHGSAVRRQIASCCRRSCDACICRSPELQHSIESASRGGDLRGPAIIGARP